VLASTGRVYALDVRNADGHRESYDGVGADVDARYADCERWLDGRIAERKRRAGLSPLTVGEHLDRWFWSRYRNAQIPTQRTYRTRLRRAEPIWDVLVADLTPAHIDRITDGMVGEGLSPRFCRLVRSTLHSAFDGLVPSVLPANPVGRYGGQLVLVKRRPNVWDERDADEFQRAALTHRWPPLWLLAIRYGLRSGELRALRWTDLNVRTRELTIRHGLQIGRRLADTKTHTERTIRLVPEMVVMLERFRSTDESSPTWIFAMPNGLPIVASIFSRQFKRLIRDINRARRDAALRAGLSAEAAAQTGLPDLTPHGLRHTAATLMLRRGVPVAKVAEILGHHDPSFTYRRYGWAVPSDDDVVDRAVGGLLGPVAISASVSG